MDESRILITGAGGQLGKALSTRFPKAMATDHATLDIGDVGTLEAFDWSGVDVILNAAGYTNVDGAQTSEGREAAWKINGQAVANLARMSAVHGLTLVHISSEYVFDGTKTSHTEDEALAPLGVYAQSKAAGDIAASVAPKHYIVRTSWVVGDGTNFVRTMIGLAGRNISPKVVSDQIGRLTFTETLVDGIEKLIHAKAPYGIYNLSNEGEPASWAEVTRAIFKELGRDDLTVTDVTTAEYFREKPEAAPRPLKSTLDLTKIEAVGVKPADWRTALHLYIASQN